MNWLMRIFVILFSAGILASAQALAMTHIVRDEDMSSSVESECVRPPQLSREDLLRKRDPSVFDVLVTRAGKLEPKGTATLIDNENGIFVSAAHVVHFDRRSPIILTGRTGTRSLKYRVHIFPDKSATDDWESKDIVLLQADDWDRPWSLNAFPLRIDGVDEYMIGFFIGHVEGITKPIVGEFGPWGKDHKDLLTFKGTVFAHASGTLLLDEMGRAFALVLRDAEVPDTPTSALSLSQLKRIEWENNHFSAMPLRHALDKIKAIPVTTEMRALIDELQSGYSAKLRYELASLKGPSAIDVIHLIDAVFSDEAWRKLRSEAGSLIIDLVPLVKVTCTHTYFNEVITRFFGHNAHPYKKRSDIGVGFKMVNNEEESIDVGLLIDQLREKSPRSLQEAGLFFLDRAMEIDEKEKNQDFSVIMATAMLRRAATDPHITGAVHGGIENKNYATLMGGLALAEHMANNREAARRAILAADKLGGSATAYDLAGEYALEEEDPQTAAALYAKAYATLSRNTPENDSNKSHLKRKFLKLAKAFPGVVEGSIETFQRSLKTATSASRWLALVAGKDPTFVFASNDQLKEAALRPSMIVWRDLELSRKSLNVNEETTLSGKVHVFSDWPQPAAKSSIGLTRQGGEGLVSARKLNNSVAKKLTSDQFLLVGGNDYEFSMNLKGRRPGRWRVNALLNVEDAAPIVGPGEWVEIGGEATDFKNPSSLLNTAFLIFRQLLGKVKLWYVLLGGIIFAAAAIWLVRERLIRLLPQHYHGRRKLYLRYILVSSALLAVLGLGIGAILLGWGDFLKPSILSDSGPLKLQIQPPPPIEARVLKSKYRSTDRELVISLEITNFTDEPLRILDLTSGGLQFVNLQAHSEIRSEDYLLAYRELSASSNDPIFPGKTKEVTIVAKDEKWDTETLLGRSGSNEKEKYFVGLINAIGSQGTLYPLEIGGRLEMEVYDRLPASLRTDDYVSELPATSARRAMTRRATRGKMKR